MQTDTVRTLHTTTEKGAPGTKYFLVLDRSTA